jgi:hypothetical protein
MVIHVDICHICRLIPFWLSCHIIRNHLAVDREVLEAYVFYLAALVVTSYNAHIRSILARIGNVAKSDVLDTSAWCRTIFLVEADADVEEHSLADVVDVASVIQEDYIPMLTSNASRHNWLPVMRR